jgi:predicted secreted protein
MGVIMKGKLKTMMDRLRDERAKQVIFVSHCVLNENTRYWGGAFRPAGLNEVVEELQRANLGIVQMKCPGQVSNGILRQRMVFGFGSGKKPYFFLIKGLFPLVKWKMQLQLRALAREVAKEIKEYQDLGFKTKGVVGISGSPFCSVYQKLDINQSFEYASGLNIEGIDRETFNTEMEKRWVTGEAWFAAALRRELEKRRCSIEFYELDLGKEKRGDIMEIGINKRSDTSATEKRFTAPEGMEQYLKPTEIVDFESDLVRRTAEKLMVGVTTPEEAIRSAFNYARDQILYGRISLYAKASDVIRIGMGNCTNKTTLLVALMRAVNIPARYRYASIRREGVQDLLHPWLLPLVPKVINLNCQAEIFLNGKWISLETELDPALYKGLLRNNLIKELEVDWDGEGSTHLFEDYLVDELGTYVSPEKHLNGFMNSLNPIRRRIVPLLWRMSNRHINRIRAAGRDS